MAGKLMPNKQPEVFHCPMLQLNTQWQEEEE